MTFSRELLLVVCVSLFQTTFTANTTICDDDHPDSVCSWMDWGSWSQCSKSCGTGQRTRERPVCCRGIEKKYECLKRCDLQDDQVFDVDICENVCPAGKCAFQVVNDTGIDATEYKAVYDKDGKIANAPIDLNSNEDFCRTSCLNSNVNGFSCWSYTYNKDKPINQCRLYFYNKPLSIVNQELEGQEQGQSLYVRQCTGRSECRATAADIVLVVDSSGSIGADNFEKVRTFLQGLVNNLDIDPDETRVSLLTFNDKVTWQFKLGELDDKVAVLKGITKVQYIVGGTLTSDALDAVINEGFTSNRTGVPKIAVVITDGFSRYPSLTRIRASILRQMGVEVYAIGVGGRANQEELYNMASSPEDKHMYEFSTFDDLDANNITLAVQYRPCKDKEVNSTVATLTVTTPNTCIDTVDNCGGYGKDICTDYGPWAHAHCSRYCGFCNSTVGIRDCVDGIPNCASYGSYICVDKAYVGWVDKNCRAYCGVCGATTQSTTTTVPTTTAYICRDTIENCDGYKSSCSDPAFHGYLNARCPATCGYCQSHKEITGTSVNGTKCPDWFIPTECNMVTVNPGCCPLPDCRNQYILTAEIPLT